MTLDEVKAYWTWHGFTLLHCLFFYDRHFAMSLLDEIETKYTVRLKLETVGKPSAAEIGMMHRCILAWFELNCYADVEPVDG